MGGVASWVNNKVIQPVAKTVENIVHNPIPVIETIALTSVIGPAGLGLTSAAVAAPVAAATVSAMNGGSVANIATAAISGYVGAQVASAAPAAINDLVTSDNPLGSLFVDNPQAVTIASSALGASAQGTTKALLNGQPLDQALQSGIMAGATSGVYSSIGSLGVDTGVSQQINSVVNSAKNQVLPLLNQASPAVQNILGSLFFDTNPTPSGLDSLPSSVNTADQAFGLPSSNVDTGLQSISNAVSVAPTDQPTTNVDATPPATPSPIDSASSDSTQSGLASLADNVNTPDAIPTDGALPVLASANTGAPTDQTQASGALPVLASADTNTTSDVTAPTIGALPTLSTDLSLPPGVPPGSTKETDENGNPIFVDYPNATAYDAAGNQLPGVYMQMTTNDVSNQGPLGPPGQGSGSTTADTSTVDNSSAFPIDLSDITGAQTDKSGTTGAAPGTPISTDASSGALPATATPDTNITAGALPSGTTTTDTTGLGSLPTSVNTADQAFGIPGNSLATGTGIGSGADTGVGGGGTGVYGSGSGIGGTGVAVNLLVNPSTATTDTSTTTPTKVSDSSTKLPIINPGGSTSPTTTPSSSTGVLGAAVPYFLSSTPQMLSVTGSKTPALTLQELPGLGSLQSSTITGGVPQSLQVKNYQDSALRRLEMVRPDLVNDIENNRLTPEELNRPDVQATLQEYDPALLHQFASRGYAVPGYAKDGGPIHRFASGSHVGCVECLSKTEFLQSRGPAGIVYQPSSKNAVTLGALHQISPQMSMYGSFGQLAKGGLPSKYHEAAPEGHHPEFVTGVTGYYAGGRGTGQSDDIPAMLHDGDYVIDADAVAALGDGSSKAGNEALMHFMGQVPHKKELGGNPVPAKIADGEVVLPESFVTALGGGDNKHGAKMLDQMRERLRDHKRSAPTSKIPPKAKSPLEYLRGKG